MFTVHLASASLLGGLGFQSHSEMLQQRWNLSEQVGRDRGGAQRFASQAAMKSGGTAGAISGSSCRRGRAVMEGANAAEAQPSLFWVSLSR